MPRKPSRPPVVCEFFTWRLIARDGVFYADGRTGRYNLGKHSLGTRDREEALTNLRQLDRQMAVKLGLASPSSAVAVSVITMEEGWEKYLVHCGRADVLGGVSTGTLKRYRTARDKHIAWCARQGIRNWTEIDKNVTEKYGNWMVANGYANRSVYLELTGKCNHSVVIRFTL